jgi:hypothetical protein
MNKTHCGKLGTLNALFGRLELVLDAKEGRAHVGPPRRWLWFES